MSDVCPGCNSKFRYTYSIMSSDGDDCLISCDCPSVWDWLGPVIFGLVCFAIVIASAVWP